MTPRQFLHDILPKIDQIQNIKTDVFNETILCPVAYDTLFDSQQILVYDRLDWSLNECTALGECIGLIIKLSETPTHYASMLLLNTQKLVYFVDPCNISKDTYNHLCESLKKHLSEYSFEQLNVTNQSQSNSLCHAYMNIRALVFGWSFCESGGMPWANYLDNIFYEEMLWEGNINLIVHAQKTNSFLEKPEDESHSKTVIRNIMKECIKNEIKLGQVKQLLWSDNIIHSHLDEWYVEKKYVKYTFRTFLYDIKEYINVNQDSLGIDVFNGIVQLTRMVDVGQPFNQLPSYQLVRDAIKSIHRYDDKLYLKQLKISISECLRKINSTMQAESDFMVEMRTVLKEWFISNDSYVTAFSQCTNQRLLPDMFLEVVRSSDSPQMEYMKILLEDLGDGSNKSHEHIREEILKLTKEPTLTRKKSSKTQNKAILTCEAEYLNLSKWLQSIETKMRGMEEVQVIVKRVLQINCSLHWSGVNLVILANEMHVAGNQTFNLSGCDAQNFPERAGAGENAGEDGQEGECGDPGESGGNVEIYYENMVGEDNLTIISNGGKGAGGQDGGNGKNGRNGADGKSITLDEFKERYPSICYYVGASVEQGILEYGKHADLTENLISSNDIYYIYTEYNTGNKIILSFYQSIVGGIFTLGLASSRQAYCLYKGGEGEEGQEGGAAGLGGQAGRGGFSGTINVEQITSTGRAVNLSGITIKAEKGLNGHEGNLGNPGRGGVAGTKGIDYGRLERDQYRASKYIAGHLKLEPTEDTTKPWCPLKEKYMDIVETTAGATKQRGTRQTATSHKKSQKQASKKKQVMKTDLTNVYRTECTERMTSHISKFTNLEISEEHLTEDTREHQITREVVWHETERENFGTSDLIPKICQSNREKVSENQNENTTDNIHKELIKLLGNMQEQVKQHPGFLRSGKPRKTITPELVKFRDLLFTFEQPHLSQVISLIDIFEIEKSGSYATGDVIEIIKDIRACLMSKMKFVVLQRVCSNIIRSCKSHHHERLQLLKAVDNILAIDDFHDVLQYADADLHNLASEYHWEASESPRHCLKVPDTILACLLKLKSLGKENPTIFTLYKIICERFSCEHCSVAETTLKLFIQKSSNTEILMDTIVIAMREPQSDWLAVFTLVLALQHFPTASQQENETLLASLKSLAEETELVYFAEKLDASPASNLWTMNDVITAAFLLSQMSLQPEVWAELNGMEIWNWRWKLTWYYNCMLLRSMPFEWKSDSELTEAASHALDIINEKGQEQLDRIYQTHRTQQSVSSQSLLTLLQNENNDSRSPHDEGDGDRSLDTLRAILQDDTNSSVSTDCMNQCFNIIRKMADMSQTAVLIESKDKTNKETIRRMVKVSELTDADIKLYVKGIRKGNDRHAAVFQRLPEVLAIVNHGIFLNSQGKIKLRNTQLLSIVLFLTNREKFDRGLLEQVGTGEGKSLIIVVLGIIEALSGGFVDVITSSAVLARRDAHEHEKLYQSFGISASHNCSEDTEDRQKAYMAHVVYGEIGNFQRDHLLDQFYGKNMLGTRSFDKSAVIIDEVDSMILDKGENVLYLSHNIQGFESLESVYCWIWTLINPLNGSPPANTEDIRSASLQAIFGAVTKDLLTAQMQKHDLKCDIETLWKVLIECLVIDKNGIIINQNAKWDELRKCSKVSTEVTNFTCCILKDTIRKGTEVNTPKYLESFILLHLNDWIENAKAAAKMLEGEHYVIDTDRSETGQGGNVNVVIMDTSTGTEQYNSQWSNGLHQFLQLKHGCRLNYESLKAVFMSNITFFRQYAGRIYGLTGTLGSMHERHLLKSLYDIGFINVPTFQPKAFTEFQPLVCTTEQEWLRTIGKTVLDISKTRPVLVICDTVRSVDKLRSVFRDQSKVRFYTHSYQKLDFLPKNEPLDREYIILATNLAGRGTDIKISDRFEARGGLHVCLTYLPESCRVEEQALGRAARKGQKGSGQLIILDEDLKEDSSFHIFHLKLDRHKREEESSSEIESHYANRIFKEETLFKEFTSLFKELKRSVRDLKYKEILLESVLDSWALWLDRVAKRSSFSGHTKQSMYNDICNPQIFAERWKDLIANPAKINKIAKVLAKGKNYKEAIELLDKNIARDPSFSEVSHYYKAYCLFRKDGINSWSESCKELHKAFTLINTRIDELTDLFSSIDDISTMYNQRRSSLVTLDDYKLQKEHVIEIYQQFLTSIENISHPTACLKNDLWNLPIDVFLSDQIFEKLIADNLIKRPRINPDCFSEGGFKIYNSYFSEKYEAKISPLTEKLKCLENSHHVSSQDFVNIYADREDFYNQLLKNGAIENQSQYAIIDATKVREMPNYSLLKAKIFNLPRLKIEETIEPYETTQTGFVSLISSSFRCPSLEQIKSDNYLFVRKADWENSNVSHITKLFLEHNVLYFLDIGIVDMTKADNITFSRYDSIDRNSFLCIPSMTLNDGETIIRSLQKHEFLSTGKIVKLLNFDVVDMPLVPGYEEFYTEIQNVIQTAFAYRLAIHELWESGEIYSLESYSHEHIYNDLMQRNILTTYRMTENIDSKLDKCLTKFGNDNDAHITQDEFYSQCQQFRQAWQEGSDSINFTAFIDRLWQGITKTDNLKQTLKQAAMSKLKKFSKFIGEIDGAIGDAVNSVLHRASLKSLKYYFSQKDFDSKVYSISPVVQCHFLSKLYLKKEGLMNIIKDFIENSKNGIIKHENIDANLADLIDNFDEVDQFQRLNELATFHENAFGDIITMQERKWTWKIIGRIAAIAAIGIAQIAVGVVLEVFTVGIGTHLAGAFISEGIGDLIFAAQCAVTGQCTWGDYWSEKKQSLKMTAMTMAMGGMGSLLARGAKFSRYGMKIGGDFSKLSGKALIKAAGKKKIMKEVGKRAGKKIVEAGAIGAMSGAIDLVINSQYTAVFHRAVDGMLLTFNENFEKANIKQSLENLIRVAGQEKATGITDDINSNLYPKLKTRLTIAKGKRDLVLQSASMLSDELAQLKSSGSSKSRLIGSVSKAVNKTTKGIQLFNKVNDTLGTCLASTQSILSALKQKLDQEASQIANKNSGNNTDNPEDIATFSASVCADWKQQMKDELSEQLDDLLRRILESLMEKTRLKAAKNTKKAFKKFNQK